MHKIGICGHFGLGKNLTDGQTIKTKILYDELCRLLTPDQIRILDTYKWIRKPIHLLLRSFVLFNSCENIVILPNKNGLRILLPFFVFLNIVYRRKIHYVVIGGWLAEYLEYHKWLQIFINKIDSIHVESISLKRKLEDMGVANTYYMPNFKRLNVLAVDQLIYDHEIPYRLCTFSRVIKEKGIENAIEAVSNINQRHKKTIYTLDIYGPIDESYKTTFFDCLNRADKSINYMGIIPYDKSVETLKKYFLLLFPTYYSGEGFAGTLLDSLASGVPILATNWRYNSEIVKDGVVGKVYDVNGGTEELERHLEIILQNPSSVLNMKKNCLSEYAKYDPTNVINTFLKVIEKGNDKSAKELT